MLSQPHDDVQSGVHLVGDRSACVQEAFDKLNWKIQFQFFSSLLKPLRQRKKQDGGVD